MPSIVPPDEPIATLQARAIVDLEGRIAEIGAQTAALEAHLTALTAQLLEREHTIGELERRLTLQQELLGVYQRSRAVRVATFVKRLQPGSGNGAIGGRGGQG